MRKYKYGKCVRCGKKILTSAIPQLTYCDECKKAEGIFVVSRILSKKKEGKK
jgi:hypothetical protein